MQNFGYSKYLKGRESSEMGLEGTLLL